MKSGIIYNLYCKYGYNFWFSSSKKNDARVVIDFVVDFSYENIHSLQGKNQHLDFIIINDQLVRHFYRGNSSLINEKTQLAQNAALDLLGWYFPATKEELLFITLPLRHLPSQELIDRVLAIIETYTQIHPEDKAFCNRIESATKKRWAAYQRAHREFELDDKGEIKTSEIVENWGENEEIPSIPTTHPSIQQFKGLRGKNLLLSLSGGVDSMVLAWILRSLDIPFQAYHLNYGKRVESNAESEFLATFCARYGIPLTIETVDLAKEEIQYNWEEVTRKQRFEAYLRIGGSGCHVVLGHHQDDVHENLLMNLFGTGAPSGGRYLWSGLNGMPVFHQMRGVVLYRPLIEFGFRKDWVWDMAKEFHIPYFKDTSFIMATRIQIRRQLIPMMNSIFGAGMERQLDRIIAQSELLETSFPDTFRVVGNPTETKIVLEKTTPATTPLEIQKTQFINHIKPFLFSKGINLPSHKSVRQFLIRVNATPSKLIKMQHKECSCRYENGRVTVIINNC